MNSLNLTKFTCGARENSVSGCGPTLPLKFLMNSLIMKSNGEDSSRGADLELYSGKRIRGNLNAGEGSQVRDPKKTKIEDLDFPIEVFDGYKLGGDAKFYDGLTRREITSRCLKGMGQVLSDFVRIVDGFGSGGDGAEVVNLRKALEQSEKEKTALREELSSLLYKNAYETPSVTRLQLEQSEKEKADLWERVEMIYNLYETHSEARIRLEEEQALLKAELEELKARDDKRVQIKPEMAKDDTTNTFEKNFFPA